MPVRTQEVDRRRELDQQREGDVDPQEHRAGTGRAPHAIHHPLSTAIIKKLATPGARTARDAAGDPSAPTKGKERNRLIDMGLQCAREKPQELGRSGIDP